MRQNVGGMRPALPALHNAEKRYGWFRLYNDSPSHPRWKVAAQKANCTVGDAFAVAVCLMCVGSKTKPRGRIDDFDPEQCAATLGIPQERVEAIVAAYNSGKNPWIAQGFIQSWDDRQPVREDATNAERQARYRERHPARPLSNTEAAAMTRLRNGESNADKHKIPPIDQIQTKTSSSTVEVEPVDSGTIGEKKLEAVAIPKVPTPEEEQDRAHQKLFATGVSDFIDMSGMEENPAHDLIVSWLLKTNGDAIFVLAQIEAAKNMELGKEAKELIARQISQHKAVTPIAE